VFKKAKIAILPLMVALALILFLDSAQAELRTLKFSGTGLPTVLNTNILADYRAPTSVSHLEITIALTGVDSVVNVMWDGVPFALNSGTALVANQAFTFTFGVQPGTRYNLQTAASTTAYYTITEVHQR